MAFLFFYNRHEIERFTCDTEKPFQKPWMTYDNLAWHGREEYPIASLATSPGIFLFFFFLFAPLETMAKEFCFRFSSFFVGCWFQYFLVTLYTIASKALRRTNKQERFSEWENPTKIYWLEWWKRGKRAAFGLLLLFRPPLGVTLLRRATVSWELSK